MNVPNTLPTISTAGTVGTIFASQVIVSGGVIMTPRRSVSMAALLLAALATSPAYSAPLPPPLLANQQDGVFLSDGSSFVTFQVTDETHEFFSPPATFPTPAGFIGATVYLAEKGLVCTPGSSDLGTCSDGFTLKQDPLDNHLDTWFVSNGASASELATFFANVSATTFTIAETGQWQDVTGFFGPVTNPNFVAFVQSDVPEPATLAILAIGLVGVGAIRRREAN